MKSILTIPPFAHATWSMSPHGFPKWMFSASCPIIAISVVEKRSLLKREENIVPIRTSTEALELRPEPGSTEDDMFAVNPLIYPPRLRIESAMPLTNACVVPSSDFIGFVDERSSSIGSKPSLIILTRMLSSSCTAAIVSRLIEEARTLPRLWSVWFPPSSVLPDAEKIAVAFFPNSSS